LAEPNNTGSVVSFAKLDSPMETPHFLDVQIQAFERLLQPDIEGDRRDVGLERIFNEIFPIDDVNGNYSLEFQDYSLGEPKYSVDECMERDMTYAAPLKATLRLVLWEDLGDGERRPADILEKEVYLGDLPLLTEHGTFVVIVKKACWTGDTWSPSAIPSIVTISLSQQSIAKVRQDRMGLPSINTVQEPHSPVPQASLVPVNPK